MLILNANDIKNCFSNKDALTAVKDACLIQENGSFNMPDRMHIEDDNNTFLLMPALTNDYSSTKLVSVFPDNPKINEPLIYSSVILNDGNTGKPLALINGSTLTKLRTAAVGSLGIEYTTPKGIETLGLIGAGVQGIQQIISACEVRAIKEVFIYDPYTRNLADVINKLKNQLPGVGFSIASDSTNLLSNSECIIAATTSNIPVLPDEVSLLQGRHYIGIGSFRPDMREFPDALFSLLSEVIIDTDLAKKETGDLGIPIERNLISNEQIFRLGQIINKEKQIDTGKTTFFKSVGMALFDLVTAKMIYENAIEDGIGTEVGF